MPVVPVGYGSIHPYLFFKIHFYSSLHSHCSHSTSCQLNLLSSMGFFGGFFVGFFLGVVVGFFGFFFALWIDQRRSGQMSMNQLDGELAPARLLHQCLEAHE